MKLCNVYWGSHGCDRKEGHANPLCKCGNHSFYHLDSGTWLTKSEIQPFLHGEKVGRCERDPITFRSVFNLRESVRTAPFAQKEPR